MTSHSQAAHPCINPAAFSCEKQASLAAAGARMRKES